MQPVKHIHPFVNLFILFVFFLLLCDRNMIETSRLHYIKPKTPDNCGSLGQSNKPNTTLMLPLSSLELDQCHIECVKQAEKRSNELVHREQLSLKKRDTARKSRGGH